jgi:hypothetical protein
MMDFGLRRGNKMATPPNKYGTHNRLSLLENAVTELKRDVTSLQQRPAVPGPAGKAGRDGSDCQCRNGKDGRDGAPGKDSTVTGPVGPVGIVGFKGDRGDRGPAGPDSTEALAEARAVIANFHTDLTALKATLQALIDADHNKGLYLEYLRSRAAAILKERTT